jgi:hypothetical protein
MNIQWLLGGVSPAFHYKSSLRCGLSLQSGLLTVVSVPATLKIKSCFGRLAPVEAVPCSNEVRGSEAYKRKTGRFFFFVLTLRSK